MGNKNLISTILKRLEMKFGNDKYFHNNNFIFDTTFDKPLIPKEYENKRNVCILTIKSLDYNELFRVKIKDKSFIFSLPFIF